MNLPRWTIALGLFAVFAILGQSLTDRVLADDAPKATDKDKIIGIWEITKGENIPKDATFEFTKDGKVKMTLNLDGRTIKLESTYSLDGKKLTVVHSGPDGKKAEETDTIEKLTDSEMVLKDPRGKTVEFKKKK
jgi:uncharacterized protein (TIGR03066 family)